MSRRHGITVAFHAWTAKFRGIDLLAAKRLKRLEAEKAKLIDLP